MFFTQISSKPPGKRRSHATNDSRMLGGGPVGTFEERGRLVGLALGQAALLAARSPQEKRAKRARTEPGDEARLVLNILAQGLHFFADTAIHRPELVFHRPKRGTIAGAQLLHFAGKALANTGIGIISVAPPALQHGLAHAVQAGAVALKIVEKGPIEKAFGVFAGNGGVLEVEFELAVDVGEVHEIEHAALFFHFAVEWRARHWRVEHELMEIGLVAASVLDLVGDIGGCMVLQANNRGALHADAVAAQFVGQFARVRALELGVHRVRGLQAHPHPGDAEFHEFLHCVELDGIRGGEHCHAPAFACGLHARQELQGALAVQQKILVHDEKGLHAQRSLKALHDVKELVAGFIEIAEIALASEERRGGTEAATHGAADRGNDRGGGGTPALGKAHAHGARLNPGNYGGMLDGRGHVLAQVATHPRDTFATDVMVGVRQMLDAGNRGDMAANDDRGVR